MATKEDARRKFLSSLLTDDLKDALYGAIDKNLPIPSIAQLCKMHPKLLKEILAQGESDIKNEALTQVGIFYLEFYHRMAISEAVLLESILLGAGERWILERGAHRDTYSQNSMELDKLMRKIKILSARLDSLENQQAENCYECDDDEEDDDL